MSLVGSFPFALETTAADSFISHCRDRGSLLFNILACKPRKPLHFAAPHSSSTYEFFGGVAAICDGYGVSCRRPIGERREGWNRWNGRLRATGKSSSEGAGSDERADTLQSTIEKGQKVIAVQNELIQKIAERRKLLSSIKSSIFNPEDNDLPYKDVEKSTCDGDGNDYQSGSGSLLSIHGHATKDEFLEILPEGDIGGFSDGGTELGKGLIVMKSSVKEDGSETAQTDEQPSSRSSSVILEDGKLRDLEELSLPNVNGEENLLMEVDVKPPPLAGPNVMNVILVAAECAPWSKTGGLGDVAGALPKALARRGHRVMVVVPLYGNYAEAQVTGVRRRYMVDGQSMEVTYFHAYIDGVDFVFIESPMFRHIGNNIYGGNRMDNLKRMILLCKAAVEVPWYVPCGGTCYGDGNLVFIANDWHTALLPVYLRAYYRDNGLMQYARSIIVIHNIAFQGRNPMDDFRYMDLPEHYRDRFQVYDPVGGEHLNIFAAGLRVADRVVTVSHGYAWELKTPEGGWGLHGIIAEHDWKLRGIVNGVDRGEWDPAADGHLSSDGYSNYSLETLHAGKPQCKRALQAELGLPVRDDVPLLGFIGRLDPQKGVDLVTEAVPWLVEQDAQLVMLGMGRPDLEEMLKRFEREHPERVRGWVGFSVRMAHRITAGADVLLMPSRFEPCGLNQLHAMEYGTVPVVHAVGGLRDTVQPFDPFGETETGHGWTFDRAEVGKLVQALGNCLVTYREHRGSWEGLQRRGMMQDLSWDNAAQKYEEVMVAAKYQW